MKKLFILIVLLIAPLLSMDDCHDDEINGVYVGRKAYEKYHFENDLQLSLQNNNLIEALKALQSLKYNNGNGLLKNIQNSLDSMSEYLVSQLCNTHQAEIIKNSFNENEFHSFTDIIILLNPIIAEKILDLGFTLDIPLGMWWACKKGYIEIARIFLDRFIVKDSDKWNKTNNQIFETQYNKRKTFKKTEWLEFSFESNMELFILLLNNGIEIEDETRLGDLGLNNHPDLKLLLANGVTFTSENPLIQSCINNDFREAEKIINEAKEKDGLVNSDPTKREKTALFWAIVHNNQQLVELLIKNGANIEAADYHGLTAIYWAVLYGDVSLVKFILDLKPSLDGKKVNYVLTEQNRKQKRTPLHAAISRNVPEIIQQLLQAGCICKTVGDRKDLYQCALETESYDTLRSLMENQVPLTKQPLVGNHIISLQRQIFASIFWKYDSLPIQHLIGQIKKGKKFRKSINFEKLNFDQAKALFFAYIIADKKHECEILIKQLWGELNGDAQKNGLISQAIKIACIFESYNCADTLLDFYQTHARETDIFCKCVGLIIPFIQDTSRGRNFRNKVLAEKIIPYSLDQINFKATHEAKLVSETKRRKLIIVFDRKNL